MVFYGIGIICLGLLLFMWRKERMRTEKNAMLLLVLFCFGMGFAMSRSQLVSAMLHYLFLMAPFVLGFCSVGLLIYAVSRLRERPQSRKYRVVAVSGILMVMLTILVVINTVWIQNTALFYLEETLAYLFVYLFSTFIIFLGLVVASRFFSPSLEKAIIVILGTGLTATEEMSVILKYRLDKAIQFYQNQAEESAITFLVTGGKSPGNSVSEAEVMAEYLMKYGVPEDRIIQENQSINTHQNFLYSQRLLESGDKVLFVTSSYHVLRGNVYARQLGIEAEGIGAKSPVYYLPYALVREYLALFLIYRNVHLVALPIFLVMLHLLIK